jgi:hypothetical protein
MLLFLLPMKYRILSLIFLFFSLFALTACGTVKQENTQKVPEVLMGADCGFDRLKCCDTSPTCNYGQQCCVDPNDASKNYCAENCECGNDKEFCCANNQCNGNAVCANGICSNCGGKDEVCCQSGDSCGSGLVCAKKKCVECGNNSEPCCAGKNPCLLKAGERAECLNNICSNCGFDGTSPCTAGDKCLPGQIFAGQTCERCGQVNQPCCDASSGKKYDCNPAAGLKCNVGFCSSN